MQFIGEFTAGTIDLGGSKTKWILVIGTERDFIQARMHLVYFKLILESGTFLAPGSG
jgi:hypothetical protein